MGNPTELAQGFLSHKLAALAPPLRLMPGAPRLRPTDLRPTGLLDYERSRLGALAIPADGWLQPQNCAATGADAYSLTVRMPM
jgi:hypothetical protein